MCTSVMDELAQTSAAPDLRIVTPAPYEHVHLALMCPFVCNDLL